MAWLEETVRKDEKLQSDSGYIYLPMFIQTHTILLPWVSNS